MPQFSRFSLCLAIVLPVLSACTDLVRLKKKVVSVPVSKLQWIQIPGSGGIKYADVRGALASDGPYEAFVVYPGGKDTPFHYHRESLQAVVLKGTFYITVEGKRTEFPVGSFYELPANLAHYSGCVEGPDCLLFQYQDHGFDFVPMREEKIAQLHDAERAPSRARSISRNASSSESASRKEDKKLKYMVPETAPFEKMPMALHHLWPFRSSPCTPKTTRSSASDYVPYPDSP